MLEKLNEIFSEHFETHKTRDVSGVTLTYVSIDQILNRLNKIHGCEFTWSFTNVTNKIEYVKNEAWNSRDVNLVGKTFGYVIVTGTIRFVSEKDGKLIEFSRDGVGADKWLYYNKYGSIVDDLDKGLKTAYAEALKKAAYTTGIALYLWDEGERDKINDEKEPEQPKTKNSDFIPQAVPVQKPKVDVKPENPVSPGPKKFTIEQKEKIKKLKETFSVKDNSQLVKYIVYWGKETNSGLSKVEEINPDNIDAFCEFTMKNGQKVNPF